MIPSTHSVPRLLWTAMRHRPEIWRGLRRGDQQLMINTLLDLGRRTEHPDAFMLDARPLGPKILVVYSAPGLQAMADCAALDKGPTQNIAIAISGDTSAYEGIMGPAQGRPYGEQIAILDAMIKRSLGGLRGRVRARARAHLAPPCSFTLRQAHYFSASVILDDVFPAHDWSLAQIAETIDVLETNAKHVGPLIQNSALRGEDPVQVLDAPGMEQVATRYEHLFGALAEQERQREAGADDTSPRVGLLTQLAAQGLTWSDTKALVNNFVAASYETVSTALAEWVYQVTKHPSLWRELQQTQGDQQRQRIKASLYEAVRIMAPLPLLLRRAEQACTLSIEPASGPNRSVAIEAGQLVIGLNIAPLWDPLVFPRPETMRLQLDGPQRKRIRLAWGLQPSRSQSAPDRFCQGFSYSVALLTATIEFLLEHCEGPKMLHDAPLQMFGTRSRRGFEAQLSARSQAQAPHRGPS